MTDLYQITTDGGSRGNPGPAATGFTLEGPGITSVARGRHIGTTTNNVAEYTALLDALGELLSQIGTQGAQQASVQIRTDSELVVKQVSGVYRVKDANLRALFMELLGEMRKFKSVEVIHVRRESNTKADAMVNEALDAFEESQRSMK
jgi:ribonuclease HI